MKLGTRDRAKTQRVFRFDAENPLTGYSSIKSYNDYVSFSDLVVDTKADPAIDAAVDAALEIYKNPSVGTYYDWYPFPVAV